ncbi:MAG: type III-B CRISPR module RAMP protein Cmr6 [Acidobacteriota bacterium]|nr:type III-B CRISPR module RAMP protein Cmr6 [Acidobacteriota bacterium]
MRPLYQAAIEEPKKRFKQGNAGLWFDKFCNTWRKDTWTLTADERSNPKLEWIKTVTHHRVGVHGEIEEAVRRLLQLVEARGGRGEVFRTQARFVSGLGASHPIENGFTWHPTLGVPYLRGSSIKGVVRAWAEEKEVPGCNRIFGAPDRVGSVCFLDAVPTERVRLEADVMTPHYAGWDDANPPGDWCSPTPIPFLVTAAGTPFLFGVVPCEGTSSDDAVLAMNLLAEALEITGAGAKTAVGYGRMQRVEDGMRLLLNHRKQRDELS